MIIVEGSDLVGKTTLCKVLCAKLNELGWPHVYQHLSRLPASWAADPVANYRRLASPYVVRDRFHMSEPLYAATRGEHPMISPRGYEQVDRSLAAYCAFTIVVTADPELIRARYEARRQLEMYALDTILQVNESYRQMIEGVGLWGEYRMRYDLHVHCDERTPFPPLEQIGLFGYTARMTNEFPYSGAKNAKAVHRATIPGPNGDDPKSQDQPKMGIAW